MPESTYTITFMTTEKTNRIDLLDGVAEIITQEEMNELDELARLSQIIDELGEPRLVHFTTA